MGLQVLQAGVGFSAALKLHTYKEVTFGKPLFFYLRFLYIKCIQTIKYSDLQDYIVSLSHLFVHLLLIYVHMFRSNYIVYDLNVDV